MPRESHGKSGALMAESAATSGSSASPEPLPAAPSLTELRVPITQLARVHEVLARAWGEAGVGGQELQGLFASGVKVSCVACGLGITGADLLELAMGGDEGGKRSGLPPKLERLGLGYIVPETAVNRVFKVEIVSPGRFDPVWILGRSQQLLEGRSGLRLPLPGALSPETRRATRRLALIAVATFFVAFVAYRLVFFAPSPSHSSSPSPLRSGARVHRSNPAIRVGGRLGEGAGPRVPGAFCGLKAALKPETGFPSLDV